MFNPTLCKFLPLLLVTEGKIDIEVSKESKFKSRSQEVSFPEFQITLMHHSETLSTAKMSANCVSD